MTPPIATSDVDDFNRAVQATSARLRRHATWRMALYVWFAATTMVGAAVVAMAIERAGSPGLAGMWPALATAVLSIGVVVWLLVGQANRIRSLRQRILPVHSALQLQLAIARQGRRHSAVLLMLAALSLPALLLAVQTLADRGALVAGQSLWLTLACLLPALLIGAIHGGRRQRLGQEQARLQALLEQLR